MRIRRKCSCGDEIEIEDNALVGIPTHYKNEQKLSFLIEWHIDDWIDDHMFCGPHQAGLHHSRSGGSDEVADAVGFKNTKED